jgi:hypothetical protein
MKIGLYLSRLALRAAVTSSVALFQIEMLVLVEILERLYKLLKVGQAQKQELRLT